MGIENNASDDAAEQLRKLEARVRSWKKWVSALAVCLIGAYLIYFGLILGQNPATDSDKWGTFGDFIGGVMNPIVAFAAFFWLTESVQIQKTELMQTRRELATATEAQVALVSNGRTSVRLAALTALVNIESNAIDNLNNSIITLNASLPTMSYSAQEYMDNGALQSKISELKHEKKVREKLRQPYLDEMMEILQSQR
ncbi:hypothetical protein [Comamonas sp.]|uniref:hypothetical protein n=1 Tax=Comamonas sp. TaxID=34028 RepID=UPI0028A7EE1B|nr:hypothetical protein [Comamonas sp.]